MAGWAPGKIRTTQTQPSRPDPRSASRVGDGWVLPMSAALAPSGPEGAAVSHRLQQRFFRQGSFTDRSWLRQELLLRAAGGSLINFGGTKNRHPGASPKTTGRPSL